jgi:hypothetical protein
MPFRTPPGARRDLLALIEAELRARLEEAVDHACLDAMVSARRAHDARLPRADDPRDREEFTATVRALLERLRDEIPAGADDMARADDTAGADGGAGAGDAVRPDTHGVRPDTHRLRPDAYAAHADAPRARPAPEPDARAGEESRLLTAQIDRAKALPDYWQRFETIRLRFTAEYVASRGPRRSVLSRLLGRG